MRLIDKGGKTATGLLQVDVSGIWLRNKGPKGVTKASSLLTSWEVKRRLEKPWWYRGRKATSAKTRSLRPRGGGRKKEFGILNRSRGELVIGEKLSS